MAAWLQQRYVVDGLSTRGIAAALDCSHTAVRDALLRHEIPLRRPSCH
jgi:hypothetical protein